MQPSQMPPDGVMMLTMNGDNEPARLTPPWELTLRLEAHLTVNGRMQETNVVHELSRDEAGEWRIDSDRGDGKAVHLRGRGALPAIIELNGAIMILMPARADDHTRDTLPASTA